MKILKGRISALNDAMNFNNRSDTEVHRSCFFSPVERALIRGNAFPSSYQWEEEGFYFLRISFSNEEEKGFYFLGILFSKIEQSWI